MVHERVAVKAAARIEEWSTGYIVDLGYIEHKHMQSVHRGSSFLSAVDVQVRSNKYMYLTGG